MLLRLLMPSQQTMMTSTIFTISFSFSFFCFCYDNSLSIHPSRLRLMSIFSPLIWILKNKESSSSTSSSPSSSPVFVIFVVNVTFLDVVATVDALKTNDDDANIFYHFFFFSLIMITAFLYIRFVCDWCQFYHQWHEYLKKKESSIIIITVVVVSLRHLCRRCRPHHF